ncbi:MAG: AMP-binding protein [Bdellovibrionaceae bacterium]|nr:AMP-binding protein [Pseudobdellovibrionaceae bacterium]
MSRRAEHLLRREQLSGHLVFTTSGSTASSSSDLRLVFTSKSAFRQAAEIVNSEFNVCSSDRILLSLPLFHVGGLSLVARALLSKAPIIRSHSGWEAKKFVREVQNSSVTVCSLVPTQVYDLVAKELSSPPCLRLVWVGGGALEPGLKRRALDLGWPVVGTYGMTETSAMIAFELDDGLRPFRQVDVRRGPRGTLAVRTPGLMTGFSDFGENWTSSGEWYDTEDVVEFGNGSFKVLGRLNDFVKILGESVNMARLRSIAEEVLRNHNLPRFSWIPVAVPDPRRQNSVIAASTLVEQQEKIVVEEFNRRVAPYERIVKSFYLEKIPLTETGKVKVKEIERIINEKK